MSIELSACSHNHNILRAAVTDLATSSMFYVIGIYSVSQKKNPPP